MRARAHRQTAGARATTVGTVDTSDADVGELSMPLHSKDFTLSNPRDSDDEGDSAHGNDTNATATHNKTSGSSRSLRNDDGNDSGSGFDGDNEAGGTPHRRRLLRRHGGGSALGSAAGSSARSGVGGGGGGGAGTGSGWSKGGGGATSRAPWTGFNVEQYVWASNCLREEYDAVGVEGMHENYFIEPAVATMLTAAFGERRRRTSSRYSVDSTAANVALNSIGIRAE